MAIKLLDSLQAQGVDFNKITDESTREEVISLFKALDPVLEQRIQDEAEERVKALSENDAEMARMRMGLPRRKMRDTDRAFRRMVDIWRNNGYDPEKPHVQYRYEHFVQADERRQRDAASGKLQKSDYVDTQFSTDQPILIPRVVAEFVREAIEPNIVLTGLLQNISFQNGTHVTFPASAPGAGCVRQAGPAGSDDRRDDPLLPVGHHADASLGSWACPHPVEGAEGAGPDHHTGDHLLRQHGCLRY